jgi:hypothetical protein
VAEQQQQQGWCVGTGSFRPLHLANVITRMLLTRCCLCLPPHAAPNHSGADGSRRLLQDAPISIKSNTGQKFAVSASNVQGGASIIHVIDGVLIPKSMAEAFNLTTVPGATAESMAAAETEAPTAEAPNATVAAPAGATPPPAPKSSAGTAVATLLALPTLLAVLML